MLATVYPLELAPVVHGVPSCQSASPLSTPSCESSPHVLTAGAGSAACGEMARIAAVTVSPEIESVKSGIDAELALRSYSAIPLVVELAIPPDAPVQGPAPNPAAGPVMAVVGKASA